ncbi:glycoside hydrolase family 3 N-terminal domain-containing protein [Actinacidiphila soli]|uniref:glycoside hydrolase family 3 N-terminal domain-containing protein n=1 Tax=Actinacidiphila soli TaxID=2487275 RepID=UPI000FCC3BCB|nr:glycoside hydrolase family 3 N-terminal domain-containing protein [Actinacidiphila soli]
MSFPLAPRRAQGPRSPQGPQRPLGLLGRRGRTVLAGATALLALGAVPAPAAQPQTATYLDSRAPVARRVADLVSRMTLAEKVGQTAQPAVVTMQGECGWSGGELTASCMQRILADQHVGSVLSGGGEGPVKNTPKDWAEMVNSVQKYALDHSRLHIPIVYGIDAVHGHNNVVGATKFPQQLGLGATWDPALSEQLGESTAAAVNATGPTWDFAPVLDISRDTRWGRYYETYSEDPYLAGSLGASNIKGLQSSGQVAATVKHFAGYSQPLNGHDRTASQLDMRYLQDTILPAYKTAVDAGAQTVMVNSGAVNGIPAHSSHYLLTDVLRKQWGFKGVVVSDWNDVQNLQTAYHIAGSYADAVGIAMNAGVDVAMLPPGSVDGYIDGLTQQVRDGKVSMARLNQAVSRVLTLKFQLGLFEHPYVDATKADAAVLGTDKDLAVKAATESMTLLRNDNNVLPLSTGLGKVVVAGPAADSVPDQDGGWTIGWQGIPDGVTDPGITVYQGVKALLGGDHTDLATTADDAVAKTQNADAAIVVVGEKPGAEGNNDSEAPALSADQQALVDRLQATGKPVAVVVIASRPLVLGSADDAKQLLMAWLPGSEGGTAVADVLFGRANPSGRLPVSWPKSTGDQPMYYQQLPGTNGGPSSGYDPLFAFGSGLSYTTYDVKGVTLSDATLSRNGTVKAAVQVANTGKTDGDMVVQLYAMQPVGAVLTPPKQLAAYTRVHLKAGETRTVNVSFPLSRLAVTTGDITGAGPRAVRSGTYAITVGGHSADLTVR